MFTVYCSKLNKIIGITLFETIITLVIISIVFMTAGIFIASSINLIVTTGEQSAVISNNRINSKNFIFNIITTDFANNEGDISLSDDKNVLKFKIPQPYNLGKTIDVMYSCDKKLKQLIRQLSGFNKEILLDNVLNCAFSISYNKNSTDNYTKYISKNSDDNRDNNVSNLILTYRIIYMENNKPIILSKSIFGPYVR